VVIQDQRLYHDHERRLHKAYNVFVTLCLWMYLIAFWENPYYPFTRVQESSAIQLSKPKLDAIAFNVTFRYFSFSCNSITGYRYMYYLFHIGFFGVCILTDIPCTLGSKVQFIVTLVWIIINMGFHFSNAMIKRWIQFSCLCSAIISRSCTIKL
jgi:hypothetical protein